MSLTTTLFIALIAGLSIPAGDFDRFAENA